MWWLNFFFQKTKHDALDHQLAVADGPTPQLADKGERAIGAKYQSIPSELCGSCKKN